MKIAVDISQIAYEGTGVARYTENLVSAILEYDHKNEYTFFFSSLRRSLPTSLEGEIKKNHRLVKTKIPPTILNILWNRLHVFSIDHFIGKQDIFISSDWTQPPTKAKKITIVHDLIAYKYPEELHPKTEFFLNNLIISSNIVKTQKKRLERVKKEVDLIIADSNATKQDLIELLKIPEDKIKVIYPAVKIKEETDTKYLPAGRQAKIQNTKYLLSVGKLEPRKNIPRLIDAFIKADLKNTDLLIVGPSGWDLKNLEIRNSKLEIPKNVKFLGFVSDSDLYVLYKNALCFIYPSLYEGFGYPVIEAMSLGCPVATSNISSLKEIAEGNAALFDPQSENEIKNAIVRLASDEKLRKELSEKGKRRAADFNRKSFADALLNAFRLLE